VGVVETTLGLADGAFVGENDGTLVLSFLLGESVII